MNAAQMDLNLEDLAHGMPPRYVADLFRAWAPRWPFGEEEGHPCPGGFGDALPSSNDTRSAEQAQPLAFLVSRRRNLHRPYSKGWRG